MGDALSNLWEGLGNLARDPIGETQRYTTEKIENAGDVARGAGELWSDLWTGAVGGFFGSKAEEKAKTEGTFAATFASVTGGLGGGFGEFFKGLGLDPKLMFIVLAVVGGIIVLMVLKK